MSPVNLRETRTVSSEHDSELPCCLCASMHAVDLLLCKSKFCAYLLFVNESVRLRVRMRVSARPPAFSALTSMKCRQLTQNPPQVLRQTLVLILLPFHYVVCLTSPRNFYQIHSSRVTPRSCGSPSLQKDCWSRS